MSNDFYNSSFTAIPDTLVRSNQANAEFAGVGLGFDRVQVKTRAALRAPDGEAPATLPAVAARASKSLAFDSSGNPIAVTAATSEEMDAAVAAAVTATTKAAEASASAATVSGAVNALHMLQLANGII